MRRLPCCLALLVCAGLTARIADAQGAGQEPTLVRAADANRDGVVGAEEWTRFVASIRRADGSVDRDLILARILLSLLDRADAQVTVEDVRARLVGMDSDGDGELIASEIMPDFRGRSRDGGAGSGAFDFAAFLAVGVVAQAADVNGDGTVDAQELLAFLDAITLDPDGSIDDATAVEWTLAAMATLSADRGAFTPGVYLLTISAGLDADKNGVVDATDMQKLFDELDADKNGVISTAEFSEARRRRFGARGGPGSLPTARTNPRGASRISRRRPAGRPLMPWQRSLEDALAVVERTGKPLLICVNMDDESASESLAWGRYRDPAFVELASGFVALLASPDRHTTLEHDDRGRRLPDPRFGRLVETEHLDIEPELYKRYFNGQRVAPRHVGVAPDGTILFDLYLLNSLSEIDAALRAHGKPGAALADPATLGEAELLNNPDAVHRDHLERLFVAADASTRRRLAGVALSDRRTTQQPELLRMGLRDPEQNVRLQTVWTMVQFIERAPLELLEPAFAVCVGYPDAERALLEAVRRLALVEKDVETAKSLRQLVAAHTGLSIEPRMLDRVTWSLELSWAAPQEDVDQTAEGLEATVAQLEALEVLLADRPGDPTVNLAFAATSLRFVRQLIAQGRNPSFLLEDVVRGAESATSGENPNGRALTCIAWARWSLNDMEGARATALAAVQHMHPWAGTLLGLRLLEVLADTHTRAIYAAMSRNGEVSAQLIAEARTAHELILEHPSSTARHAVSFVDFLAGIGAWGRQLGALHAALARFPKAGRLHAYLRRVELRDRGADSLELVYEQIPFGEDVRASTDWYWGLATLMAAERFVQVGSSEQALDAYARSVGRFRRSIDGEPEFYGSASHYVCLALAGTARVQADAGRLEEAMASLEESVLSNQNSLQRPDGLGNTPTDNAKHVYAALFGAGRAEQARTLKIALAEKGLELGG